MADLFNTISSQQLEEILTQSEFEEIGRIGQPVPPDTQIQGLAQTRFKNTMGDEEIARFIAEQKNENKRKKTASDMRLFKAFCLSRGENRPVEHLQPMELDTLFGHFLISVKKQNGEEYEPSSIRGFVSSLDRYLKESRYPHTIIKINLFQHTNEAMKAKMKALKAHGYGSKPNESDELTDSDIDKLFECGQIGTETPVQVTNILHLSFSLVLGMRGGVEQRNLQWGDMALCTDEDGDEYLCYRKERQTKTRVVGDPKDLRKFKLKVWNNKDNKKRCRKLTNHSVRKHLLQKCNDMGLAPTATVQISGHKNLQSINSYSKLNEQQQKKISTALISTESYMSNIALQNSPPAAAAPHIPYSHRESPTNQSQAITYKRQSAHSQMSTIFQENTTITGGVFNFFTAERCQSSPQRPKKFRRIMQIDSDSG